MRIYFDLEERRVFNIFNENTNSIVESPEQRLIFRFRKIANHYFYSLDDKKWNRFIPQSSNQSVLINEVFKVYKGFLPSGLSEADQGSLVTQMPGKIIKIKIKKGQKVEKGDTLLVMEAMKMENNIKANIDGIVKEIFVTEGMSVESGFILTELERL